MSMIVRDAAESDLPGILAIYNHAVEHTTAIWNETLVDLDNRRKWLADRRGQGLPVLVAVEETNQDICGYAAYAQWRAFDGYRHTVEHSVYVRHDRQRRGIGQALMIALIDRAIADGRHAMVAAIEASNAGSIALHERLGFSRTGYMPEVGIKFGRWLDLAFMQKILNG